MKIGIDSRPNIPGTGIGVVMENTLSELNRIFPECELIYFGKPLYKSNIITRFLSGCWEQFVLPFLLIIKGIKVFICFGNIGVPLVKVCKYIIYVHDIVPYIFSREYMHFLFLERQLYRLMLFVNICLADIVITGSYASKNDIVRFFGNVKKKIRVIYYGIDRDFDRLENKVLFDKIKRKYGIYKFIMCVGFTDPKKNLKAVIKAYINLRKEKKVRHKLVIIGRRTHSSNFPKDLLSEIGDDLLITGYIPKQDLVILYNAADVFVFPSLYEGFGLPLLEAMACGCPVIASNIPSIVEIVGDAAILVDPHDISQMQESIYNILDNYQLRDELRKRALNRVKNFSWVNSVIEYRTILNSLLKIEKINQ